MNTTVDILKKLRAMAPCAPLATLMQQPHLRLFHG